MSALNRKLLRDLTTQRAQFLAILVTVFLGAALFGASYDAYRNLQASYEHLFTELRFANLWVNGGDVEAFARRARQLEGVQAVETRTQLDVPLRVDEAKLLGRVVGLPAAAQPEVNRVAVLEGEYLSSEAPEGVLVEQHMADHFALEPGDSVELLGSGGWRELEVRGIAASTEYLWPARSRQDVLPSPENFGVLFAPQELVGPPNQAVVYFRDGREDAPLLEALEALALEHGGAGTFDRSEQPSNAALQNDIKGFAEFSYLFPVLFLSAAGMAGYVLLARRVHTERQIIGTLRALGTRRRAIVVHYLGYGLLAGLAGSALGAVAGLLLARQVTGFYTAAIDLPVTLVTFRPETALIPLALGLVWGILAAGAPALAAAAIEPAEAMRGHLPQGKGSHVRLQGLPVGWRLAVRNLLRSRRRTLLTILGVVLALTLILVSWGMLDSMEILLDRQFGQVERQDARVYFVGPVDLESLQAVEGVAAVEPAAELPVTLTSEQGRYQTALVALSGDTAMHEFLADGRQGLPAAGILAGSSLRQELGVQAGQSILVEGGAFEFEARVAGFLEEPLGTLAYLSLEALEAAASAGPNAAYVRFREGADRQAVLERIRQVPQVAAVQDSRAMARTLRDLMALFYAFVGLMLAFGGAMAFAILFATMSVNIAERTVELATLRAAGVAWRTLSRLVAMENLLVALVGLAPGLLVGYLAARGFMSAYQNDMFRMELHLRPWTPWASAGLILLVALVSQVPGLRAVGRLDIARVVRERSL